MHKQQKHLYITMDYSTITIGYSKMVEISENGKKALKLIFTDFLTSYNSYNLKDKIGLSSAGSLKLLRSLNQKNLLLGKKMGNAIFYRPNFQNEYLIKLLELIFLDHSNWSDFVKGWICDLRTFIPHTGAILLFGSIMMKVKEAGDVYVCFILKSAKDYQKLQAMVSEMNKKNRLKIHPLYLTEKGFEQKLREKDKPLVEMVKSCMIIHGQELFVEVLKNVQSE